MKQIESWSVSAEVRIRRSLQRHEKRARRHGLHGAAHQIRIARVSHEAHVLGVREATLRNRGARPLGALTPDDARRARFVYVMAADAVARYRASIGGAS